MAAVSLMAQGGGLPSSLWLHSKKGAGLGLRPQPRRLSHERSCCGHLFQLLLSAARRCALRLLRTCERESPRQSLLLEKVAEAI